MEIQDADMTYVQVKPIVAKAVEHLEKLSSHRSPTGLVDSENDWKILHGIHDVWKRLYPQDYLRIIEQNRDIKSANQFSKGITKSGSAMIQQQLEIPEKFHVLMSAMFPLQGYTKEFVKRFSAEFPQFNVTKL